MTRFQKASLFVLRLTVGWLFFYAGYTKVINPEWSAEGYLKGAKLFNGFYAFLASPSMLSITNFVNEWSLTLIGLFLILGIFVKISSIWGAIMMFLYYLPLGFPYPNTHSFVVDEHIIYIGAFLVLAAFSAGRIWGLENWCANLPICERYPKLRYWLG